MERWKVTYEIFFGIEHRMRNEETEETFNLESKEGWTFAADAARITDENASGEDCKHASGGVFVAIDCSVGAVVDKEAGTIMSIESPKTWVNNKEACGFRR